MVERIQQLSAGMAAGNADAVEAFYRQYFDWMYWQARRATKRDEAFCLDVVQDAVLRVIRTVKAVESERRFLGWLQLVVRTTAFDLLRNEKRRKNREAMAGTSVIDVDTDSLQLDWLAEQISALDPELVKIIELRFEQSWTLRRIGETLGVSIGAVDGRLRRALKDLRLAAEEPPAVVTPIVAEIVTVEAEEIAIVTRSSGPCEPLLIFENVIDENETLPARSGGPCHGDVALVSDRVGGDALIPVEATMELSPVIAVESEPGETVSDALPVPELVELEDEAGAYDDRL